MSGMKWNRIRYSGQRVRSASDDEQHRSTDAAARWLSQNTSQKVKKGRKRPPKQRTARPIVAVPSMDSAELLIFCDGACEPNPGAGGWGVAIYRDGQEIETDSGGDPDTTNNRMELTGLLVALRHAASFDEPCIIWCDSQYAVKGANEWMSGWKKRGWQRGGPKADPKNRILLNADLWREIDDAKAAAPNVVIRWCKGHAGITGNERADELSMMAIAAEAVPTVDPLEAQYREIMSR